MSNKKWVWLLIPLAVLYFVLLFSLPGNVLEDRMQNMPFFIAKLSFLSITAAGVTLIAIMAIIRRDYTHSQIETFNRYKHFLCLLVKRDFVSRYRKSVLGILWSLLNPLLTMLVMTIVFSYLFRLEIENFPVYLLSGQIIMSFFSESTTLAMGSIIAGEGFIKKVYIPKYIFPLSRVISSLVNMLFSIVAFLLVFIITGAPFHWTIFLIPIPIVYTFLFSLGFSMLLSSLSVQFRDLNYLYSVFLTILTYLTPIFYPVTILPYNLVPVIGLNPLYHFVDYFRSLAINGMVPGLWENIVCIGFVLASLCSGVYVFTKQQDKYILYL